MNKDYFVLKTKTYPTEKEVAALEKKHGGYTVRLIIGPIKNGYYITMRKD